MARRIPESGPRPITDGCSYHPHCLSCPLPMCRFDLTTGQAAMIRKVAALGREVEDSGDSVEVVAKRQNIPHKTAMRYWGLFKRARRIERTMRPPHWTIRVAQSV